MIYGNYLNITITDSLFKNINLKKSLPVFCNTKYSTINILNTRFQDMKYAFFNIIFINILYFK